MTSYLDPSWYLKLWHFAAPRAEYDNDSFIIDDDGANKEGDLTDSADASAADKNDSKVSKEWV